MVTIDREEVVQHIYSRIPVAAVCRLTPHSSTNSAESCSTCYQLNRLIALQYSMEASLHYSAVKYQASYIF